MPVRDQTLSKRQARDLVDITENAAAIGGTNDGDIPALTQTSADLTDNSGGTPTTTIAAIGATYVQAEVRDAVASLAAQADAHTAEVTVLVAAVRELAVRVNELLDRQQVA